MMYSICSDYNRRWLEIIYSKKFFLIALGFLLLHLFYWISYHFFTEFFAKITQEDGVFEYAQAILYFGCFILYTLIFLRRKMGKKIRVWAIFFALGFLFIAGEEISWGQRILGFHVDTVENISVQGEFNFHNYPFLNISPSKILTMISLGYGVLLPLFITLIPPFKKLLEKLEFPVPHPVVGICFTLSYLWYWLYHPNSSIPVSIEESRETSIAIGFFLSTLLIYESHSSEKMLLHQ